MKLDAVGLQGHLQPRYPHDPSRFQDFLHELAGNGVDIYITEFDVRDDTFSDDIQTRDKQIADVAGQFLANVLQVPQVKMLITWQLADHYSFYTGIAKHKNPQTTRLPRPLPTTITSSANRYGSRLRRLFSIMTTALANAQVYDEAV